jgi:glycosyltransferase involved in cell wall biosynthesis
MTPGKGIDLLLEAFARLATKYSNIKLVLKDQKNLYGIGAIEVISKFIEESRKRDIRLSDDVMKRIIVIDQNLTLQQLALLYASSDCYVSPYRAEGFNLPPLEAASCGVPIIVTGGGATDEYASADFAMKIESRVHITRTGNYLEPIADSILESMEKIITRTFKVDSFHVHERIRNRFSWQHAVKLLVCKFEIGK